jgi:hypothetical protein
MEAVAAEPYNGHADLPPLATSLQIEIDELFPAAETLQLLRFAEKSDGEGAGRPMAGVQGSRHGLLPSASRAIARDLRAGIMADYADSL